MCMRCGKRRSPRRDEAGCTCHQELAACKTSGKHGQSVTERKDKIFPDYIHVICNACGHECGTK